MTKTATVTARIPMERKKKIDSLKINTTEVIRESLKKEVDKQERLIKLENLERPSSVPERLRGLEYEEMKKLYYNNRLSRNEEEYFEYIQKLIDLSPQGPPD